MNRYEESALINSILEGRAHEMDIEESGNPNLRTLFETIERKEGSPIVETLINVWKKFGVRGGDRIIKMDGTLTLKKKNSLENERDLILKHIQESTMVQDCEPFYYKGIYHLDREITKKDIDTACDIILGNHKVCKVASSIFSDRAPNLCTASNLIKLVNAIDFTFSSIPNVIRLLDYSYVTNCRNKVVKHIVGEKDGMIYVMTSNGKVGCTGNVDKYLEALKEEDLNKFTSKRKDEMEATQLFNSMLDND